MNMNKKLRSGLKQLLWLFIISQFVLVTALSFKLACVIDSRIASCAFDVFGSLNCMLIFLIGRFRGIK